MAVLEEVAGVKVTVRINNVDCVEYDSPEPPEEEPACPTSSKYIESRDDAEFTIHIAVSNEYAWGYRNHSLSCKTHVDSERVACPVISYRDHMGGQVDRTIRGQDVLCSETGSWQNYGLKFSAVKTVDDATKDRLKKDLEISSNLGTIEVTVKRCIVVGDSLSHAPREPKKTSLELAEKSLKGKAISHGTTLSATGAISKPHYVKSIDIDEDNGPIAIFQFLYRSKKALQQELIIPPSPSRSPTLDALSDAERDRLARERLEQINAEKMSFKKEIQRSVKREFDDVLDLTGDNSPGQRSKVRRTTAEIIDLTEDD